MDLQTKEATVAGAEEIVSFHNAAHGDSRKPEHWMWKYKSMQCGGDFTLLWHNHMLISQQQRYWCRMLCANL